MGWLISFEEKAVTAKGLNNLAKPSEERVKEYLFPGLFHNRGISM